MRSVVAAALAELHVAAEDGARQAAAGLAFPVERRPRESSGPACRSPAAASTGRCRGRRARAASTPSGASAMSITLAVIWRPCCPASPATCIRASLVTSTCSSDSPPARVLQVHVSAAERLQRAGRGVGGGDARVLFQFERLDVVLVLGEIGDRGVGFDQLGSALDADGTLEAHVLVAAGEGGGARGDVSAAGAALVGGNVDDRLVEDRQHIVGLVPESCRRRCP